MSLPIEMASRILEACKQRAKELRSPVSIAIVDAGGHLVLFERMMSPYGWATSDISIAKANTSVMFNQSTDAVAQWGSAIPGFASSMATMTHGRFIMAAGGWPIRINGITLGGIGVSGGNAPGRDDEIARAGLAVLEAMAPPIPAQPQQLRQPGQDNEFQPSQAVPVLQPQGAKPTRKIYPPNEFPMTQHLPSIEENTYSSDALDQFNVDRSGEQK
ncbi:heme-binding protein [Ktedonosporobacter rubrisoli]|uniref:Heme-binding protein n=1 Tax=Ktedonosporobacter rubrisoli TaxID=2509675 RepID=A0A4P6JZC5_KTERU|nr:heme-binding protein [Ktedonosporobacter rubrisoli]QBD81084.1 heme-binding protein [Ktedonosporobacter rubrisoli]